MRLSQYLPYVVAILVAAGASVVGAMFAVDRLEERASSDVRLVLVQQGLDWVELEVDGLDVSLSGTAPDEAARFRALSVAGTVVDASRVIDKMGVAAPEAIEPPDFAIEILRNFDGVSLIGLVPAAMDREDMVDQVRRISGSDDITDLLEVADFPVPEGWDGALEFALGALATGVRSKISVSSDFVSVTAIADSNASKQTLEATLARNVPDGVVLNLDISAPRPVVAPFSVRFIKDADGTRFDSCTADSIQARDAIVSAAVSAGFQGQADCVVGLGSPTRTWSEAVVSAIQTVDQIGGGRITFSDTDVTLAALPSTEPSSFDLAVGQLENRLPDAFTLHAIEPEPVLAEGQEEDDPEIVPEFVGVLAESGELQMRGRLPDNQVKAAVDGYARARFGVGNVVSATRLDGGLPSGWPLRVLSSLEALSALNHGSVIVRQESVEIKGATGDPEVRGRVSRLLSEKLGTGQDFTVDVLYQESLKTVEAAPEPEECVDRINSVLSELQIKFAPGSTEIEEETVPTIDKIVEILRVCQTVRMEIGGHTDSQGRESMNLRLSQARADAVLTEIMSRRILTSNLSAKGYGETEPIADNGEEEGRELNRRIEFKLFEEEEPSDDEEEQSAEASDTETEIADDESETEGASE